MDVKILEYLLVLEQEGTISKAAEKIHISQSALSQNLSKIEQELGTPLFQRIEKKLYPTAAGTCYLNGIRKMIQIKRETYERIENLTRQENNLLRIAVCPQVHSTYGNKMLKGLKNVVKNYHLKFHETESITAKEYLINNFTDAAILCANSLPNGLLQYYPLYQEHLMLAVPQEMSWNSSQIQLQELKKCPFVLPSGDTFLRPLINHLLESTFWFPRNIYESAKIDDVKMLAEHGYGAAFLPVAMTTGLEHCRLYSWPSASEYQVVFAYSKYSEKQQPIMELYHALCQLFP